MVGFTGQGGGGGATGEGLMIAEQSVVMVCSSNHSILSHYIAL